MRTVSVTASPAKAIEATVDAARSTSRRAGFRAIPHLSARMIRDRAHLADLLDAARAGRVTRAFVVGGDAHEPGDFRDGLSLLRAMDELGHPFSQLGCPAYPQGHPDIPGPRSCRRSATRRRTWSTSRRSWASTPRRSRPGSAARRAEGFAPSIVIGVPGVADPQKLLTIAARIGVADARQFLDQEPALRHRARRSGGFYKPTRFVEGVAPLLADPGARRHRAAPVHVQRGRGHRGVAPRAARAPGSGGRRPGMTRPRARQGRSVRIVAGKWLAETESVVHFGANEGPGVVVILAASLLQAGESPAIPMPSPS